MRLDAVAAEPAGRGKVVAFERRLVTHEKQELERIGEVHLGSRGLRRARVRGSAGRALGGRRRTGTRLRPSNGCSHRGLSAVSVAA